MALDTRHLQSLRAGDVVRIEATVKRGASAEDIYVSVGGQYGASAVIGIEKVHSLLTRAFAPGENAMFGDDVVTVLSVDGDEAWVRFSSGERKTVVATVLWPAAPVEDGGSVSC
ncbi:MAG: hypothetical protein DI527_00340 [Chelatococcus sp.]|nr:MAG: hypothetical protein DI527_00340 [Chelatococcus sp.]